MANAELGKTQCPICDGEASIRQSGKNGKPYIMCGECGFQGFARGAKAVERMNARIKPAAAQQQTPQEPQKKSFFDLSGAFE